LNHSWIGKKETTNQRKTKTTNYNQQFRNENNISREATELNIILERGGERSGRRCM
jgi:hypothetical protein